MKGRLLLWLAAAATLSGCQSDKNVAFDRLNSISTSVTASEIVYIHQAAEADCRSDLLQRAFVSSTGGTPLDVTTPCASFADKTLLDQYDALLKGIAAYTAALQAEEASGSTASLDDASKSLATQFGNAGKTSGSLAKLGPGNAVTTAVESIASWAAGKVAYRNAKEAATNQKPNLELIVNQLKDVNKSIAAHMTTVHNQRVANVEALRMKTTYPNPATQFIVQTQLMEIAGLVPNTASWIGPASLDQIDHQLDALVKCNNAISVGGKHVSTACAAIGTLAATTATK